MARVLYRPGFEADKSKTPPLEHPTIPNYPQKVVKRMAEMLESMDAKDEGVKKGA